MDLEPEVATDEDEDELLLGADDILTSPVGSAPIAPPEDDDAASRPQPAAERCSSACRTSRAARPRRRSTRKKPTIKRDPIDIPRFLNRQNNQ